MILSDVSIKKEIEAGNLMVAPLSLDAIQPASVELSLGNEFIHFPSKNGLLNPCQNNDSLGRRVSIVGGGWFLLHPGEFALGSTVEYIRIPPYMVARLEGKSSLGRLGLIVHATAGFFDPGFEGTATLEFSNLSASPMQLWPGMAICQMSFSYLSTPAERPYGSPGLNSKYQGQSGPVASRYYQNKIRGRE